MLDRMFTSEALEEALWILKNEFPMAIWETMYVTVLATLFAIVLGLPLGTLFHTVVMSMVRIDLITFNCTVTPISYLFAFLFSVLFAVIVNGMMKRQVAKVNMAESLKAVE